MAMNLFRHRQICGNCWKFLKKIVSFNNQQSITSRAWFWEYYRCAVLNAVDGGGADGYCYSFEVIMMPAKMTAVDESNAEGCLSNDYCFAD